MKRNTLLEDFEEPLDKVQRNWLRRTALIGMMPVVIIMGAIGGIYELTYELFKDCWNYKTNN